MSTLRISLVNSRTNFLLIRHLTRTQLRFLSTTIFFLRLSEDNKLVILSNFWRSVSVSDNLLFNNSFNSLREALWNVDI